MARKLRLLATCSAIASVLVLTSSIRISAQTSQSFQYVIPHFSANAGSQFIVSNLSGANANPEVALRDSESGQLADTFIFVGAGTQQRLTAASFALSSFEGSVVLTSAVRLSAVATIAAGNEFETVPAFEATVNPQNPLLGAPELIVPLSQGTTGQMQLTVFNPNNSQTSVIITPVQSNGLFMSSVQTTLPALGTLRENIASLFPQPASGPVDMSHLLIRVPTSIFGPGQGVFAEAEMVNFSDPTEGIPAPRADFSAVNGVSINDAASSGTIPFFTVGGDYATEVQFINTSVTPATVTLTANGLDGNIVPGTVPTTISLAPSGAVRHNLQNIFAFPTPVEGSINFSSTTTVIAAEAIAGISRTSFVVKPSGPKPDTNFAFPVRDFNPSFFTGLSFLNPDPTTAAHITLQYMSDDGTPNSTAALTLDPSLGTAETTEILATLMPEVQTAGFIDIQSDAPIIASALEGALDNSILAALPALHPQPNYTPPASTTFLISGSVLSNGVPLPGATMQLSGPGSLTGTTDQNGNFKFTLQPAAAGNYTLTASATGYNLSAPATIQITADANGNTGGSSRNNNFTATLQTPVITTVQPAGIVVGSGSTTLVVVASPISPNGQIIFDGNPLVTTLTTASTTGMASSVSSGTGQTVPALQATIDSSLLAGTHQASIVVQTRDTASTAQSLPYVLGVGTTAPVLLSFGPLPSPLIAGCCPLGNSNPGLTTTISGTGFLQGVTVQINVGTAGTTNTLGTLGPGSGVTFVSPTSIQVTIPPQFLAIGAFLNVTVTNPAPTVGASNALPLTVFNPAAVVTSITPANANVELEANAPALPLTANGFGFQPGATLTVGGTTIALDLTQPETANSISGLIPSTLIQIGGPVPVTVVNPDPVVGTPTAVPLNLFNLPPVVASVQPTNGPLVFDTTRSDETYNASIVVSGANYSSASIFELVNQCAPIAVSPTSVTVPVFTQRQFTAYLKGVVATSSQVSWTVMNSSATGTGSVGQIDVNGLYTAPPVLPNPAVVIVQATSKADPTKFAIATVTIVLTPNGSSGGVPALAVSLINSHTAILTVSISCAGNYLIDVLNPQPGGGISQKVMFTVGSYAQPATPIITSFSPPTAPGLNVPFALTISGSNFETSPNLAYVSFGSTILFPTSVTSSTIVVNVPGYLINAHGNIPVVVVNPDMGSSTVVPFPVF